MTLAMDAREAQTEVQDKPDLAVKIKGASCELLKDGELYKRSVTARVEVKNLGAVEIARFHIRLTTPDGEDEEQVTVPLAPGKKLTMTLEVTAKDWSCCCYPPVWSCPTGVSIAVKVDSRDRVDEGSERNNVDGATTSCR